MEASRTIIYCALICFFSLISPSPQTAVALTNPGEVIKQQEIGWFTVLGTKLDHSLRFTDQTGVQRELGTFFSPSKPTILLPVYYGCPRMCGLLLNGVVDLLKQLELKIGSQYSVIAVSFDPLESSKLAAEKAQTTYEAVAPVSARAENWAFLVGDPDNVSRLMAQIGFNYKKDGDEFAHPSGIIVLTPQGEISQYFTGVEFSPWDVRLALVEASKGAIGTAIDHILLFCYRFDPTKGQYTWVAFNFLRGGVLLAVLLCAVIVFIYSRSPKRA